MGGSEECWDQKAGPSTYEQGSEGDGVRKLALLLSLVIQVLNT